MDDAAEKKIPDLPKEIQPPNGAWQPFTPCGVARSAHTSIGSLLAVQFIIALAAAAVLIWFLNANYSPAILEAIQNLPDQASLQNGKLTNVSSKILAERKFLSIVLDLEKTGQLGEISDVKIELRPDYFQICSLFGCGLFEYPKGNIFIGRATAEPWWGAREPIILGIVGTATLIGVWLSWLSLALIYAPIAKLIAYLADRELSWSGSWKLSCAGQLFAALLMIVAILLYGIQVFDLIRFLFFFSAHFLVAWLLVGTATYFLPRVSTKISTEKSNPFT